MTARNLAAAATGALAGILAAVVVALGTAETGSVAGGIVMGPAGPLGVVDSSLAVIPAIVTALLVLLVAQLARVVPSPSRWVFWATAAVVLALAVVVSIPFGAAGAVPVRVDAITWVAAQPARSPFAIGLVIAAALLAWRARPRESSGPDQRPRASRT